MIYIFLDHMYPIFAILLFYNLKMSSEFPGKVEILPENYNNCDYTFKIIIIGDSGKFIIIIIN